MKKPLLAAIAALACLTAAAQNPYQQAPVTAPHDGPDGRVVKPVLCDRCGTVQSVHQVKRKGEGGAAGVVGGAVVGGLLGNQIGKGSGRTLATVGGAVAGGYAGNEIQKQATSKVVWVTDVRMKDGSHRTFEHAAQPTWHAGSIVRLNTKGVLVHQH